MPASQEWNLRRWLLPGLFFVLFYIHVFWLIDPALHFHALRPVFLLDQAFFRQILGQPGGLVEYAAAFLMQFYRVSWLGAAISSLALLALSGTFLGLLGQLGAISRIGLALVPAVVLWMFSSRYAFPWLNVGLGLTLTALGLFVYLRMPLSQSWQRGLSFFILTGALYYLAGAQSLGFVLGAVLYEILFRRRYLLAAFCLLCGAATPAVGAWFFVRHLQDGFLLKLPFAQPRDVLSLPLVLFLLLPLTPVVAWIADWHRRRAVAEVKVAPAKAAQSGKMRGKHPSPTRPLPGPILRRPWLKPVVAILNHPLVLALVGQCLALASFDLMEKRLIQIDHYTLNREWGKVLKAGNHLTSFNQSTIADINRALGQTGRLCYDMFAYPQRMGFELWLWLHDGMDTRQCMKASELLFELGQINKSERMACESLEIVGYRPETLQRLALIKVLKDQPQAARIFLNLLRKSLFHRRWAATVLQALDQDPKLGSIDEVARVRSFMITEDYYGSHTSEAILQQLLRQNRLNRMAFEYLMAYYLLNQQLEKVYLNIMRLEDFHYLEIPRHIEEALLLHQRLAGKPLSLRGNRIRPQTERRFQEFHERFMGYQGNLQAARLGLLKDFGDTYWFYYMFGSSGWALTQADLNANLTGQP